MGPRGASGLTSEEKNIRPHWELNPELSCRLAGSLLTTLTDLPGSHATVVGISKSKSIVTVLCVSHVFSSDGTLPGSDAFAVGSSAPWPCAESEQ